MRKPRKKPKKFSQREALRMRRELNDLRTRMTNAQQGYNGQYLAVVDLEQVPETKGRIWTAQALDYTVVVRLDGSKITLRAVKL